MIISLNETKIRALERVRAVLDGTHALEFTIDSGSQARCEWVESVLKRFRYTELRRPDRGLVLTYLCRFSGFR